jgi:RHS repeat-associated protein
LESRFRRLFDEIDALMRDGIDHSITYDAAGNETHSFVDRLYGARNELTVVTDSSVEGFHQLQYVYDWRGVRVQRFESTTSASNWVSRDFFYSPELQLLTVTRDNGPNVWTSRRRPTTMTVADPMHEIVWLGSLPVAQISPGDLYFPLRYTFTDHLGTPVLQTDQAGASVWRAEYEPYGQVWTIRQGTRTEQPLRLPGQELAMTWEGQEENYNIFRWYRAGWGRYTQSDPIGLQGGVNLYGYGNQNPLAYIDPFGLIGQQDLDKMDCCQLRNQIWKAWKELKKLEKHELDPSKIKAGSAFDFWWNYNGHLLSWLNYQKRLSQLLNEYNGRPCDPQSVPKDASDYATKDYPEFDWDKFGNKWFEGTKDLFKNGPKPPKGPVIPGLPPLPIVGDGPVPVFP